MPNPTNEPMDSRAIDYKAIFDKMINGFALHEIVLDGQGRPVDYRFIEVNPAFEKMTGLKRSDIVGKLVTEAIPGIEKDLADWIGRYSKVALTGQDAEFENDSTALNKTFHVSAYSPKKRFFITIFDDVTARKQAEIALKKKGKELDEILEDIISRELKMIEMKKDLEKIGKVSSK